MSSAGSQALDAATGSSITSVHGKPTGITSVTQAVESLAAAGQGTPSAVNGVIVVTAIGNEKIDVVDTGGSVVNADIFTTAVNGTTTIRIDPGLAGSISAFSGKGMIVITGSGTVGRPSTSGLVPQSNSITAVSSGSGDVFVSQGGTIHGTLLAQSQGGGRVGVETGGTVTAQRTGIAARSDGGGGVGVRTGGAVTVTPGPTPSQGATGIEISTKAGSSYTLIGHDITVHGTGDNAYRSTGVRVNGGSGYASVGMYAGTMTADVGISTALSAGSSDIRVSGGVLAAKYTAIEIVGDGAGESRLSSWQVSCEVANRGFLGGLRCHGVLDADFQRHLRRSRPATAEFAA